MAPMSFVRHCPRCASDYQPHLGECAECGGPLEDKLEGSGWTAQEAASVPPPPAPEDLPPGNYETLYFSYAAADLQPLAGRLSRRGIPFRIDTLAEGRRAAHPRYELLVRDQERQTAREELLHLLGGDTPLEEARSLDQDFDPESGYQRCPGCSTELNQGQRSCHECGLMLGGDEGGDE
jgi:hypothetical protein